ncbi:Na+/H+ antiporter NhaC family protein [Brevibacterium zhoupengii]|uniref:Na+/H+ antiporter NhaC family protein n=1 Tax=Brevibacterium zhoupengii TaxID=2898795 RepID=UPI001F08E077|nr:Na+/H+ antiporter NhaC family protein [Brevibacterium zhoupengii]
MSVRAYSMSAGAFQDDNSPDSSTNVQVKMRGGPIVAMVPALVFVGVLVWLSLEERATISGFWVGGWAAIVVGLILSTTRRKFTDSIIRGLSDQTGAVIITAFIFAGIFGSLLSGGGLAKGLLWLGLETGVHGGLFTVLAFVLACIFAAGTGTSVGTVIAMVPVLYPAGVNLGSDPTMLAIAIIAGGAFGDNIAPVSDSTISSAYTQKARMGDVVRTRLPLALSAAGISIVVFAIFGGGGTTAPEKFTADSTPLGLVMLISFALVIVLAIRGHHIIASLTWGTLTGIALGLATGLLHPAQIFAIPPEKGGSTGLIEDGIQGVSAAVILVLFILALAQLLTDSGLMGKVLHLLQARAAKGVRSAELTIIAVTILFTIPLGSNAPAILLVGPTLARPLGLSHSLAPTRTANLLDCSANTVFYMLPWHNAVIVWYVTVLATATEHGIPAPSIAAAFLNPYAWGLLVVLLTSVLTGWNRQTVRPHTTSITKH